MKKSIWRILTICIFSTLLFSSLLACNPDSDVPSGSDLEDQITAIIAKIDPATPSTYGAPEEIIDFGRDSVPIMLELLESPDLPSRYAAVYVLSRLAEPEDIPEMLVGLEDDDFGNRATIAATLIWLGDNSGIEILEAALLSDEVLSFSHPPELLADYARRVLDEAPQHLPSLPGFDRPGGAFLSAPLQAPLRDVTVELEDCTIKIVVNLQFVGAGATQALADSWAAGIKDMWEGVHCSVCCAISITVNTKVGGDPDEEYAQVTVIQMPHAGARHTSNMTLGGTVMEGGGVNNIVGEWDSNDTPAVAAHEVGHGMGVEDEYGEDGKPTGEAVGESEGDGVPSIMAQTWKDKEKQDPEAKARHVDQILAHHGIECPDKCGCIATPTPKFGEALAGFFVAFFEVAEDPGGHGPFTDLPIEQYLRVEVTDAIGPSTGDIAISAAAPFVPVYGTIVDGVFSATGVGTVAGFPNISVLFEGSITNPLAGVYTLGVNGGLPGGLAISYNVEGTKDAPLEEPEATEEPDEVVVEETQPVEEPETVSAMQLVETFSTELVNAMQSHDTTFLFDRLHPAVFDLYGEDACNVYLEGVAGYSQIVALDVQGPEAWTWEIDGVSIPLEDIYTIDVELTLPEGKELISVLHYALVDGELLWFTDCGEPLP